DTSKFDLGLALASSDEGLAGGLIYRLDLWEPATVRRMAAHFRRVLEQVAEDPDAPLSRLELVDAAERRRVIEEWNDTAAPYPSQRCIHQLFEEQAARTPGAVAVTFPGGAQTYAGL